MAQGYAIICTSLKTVKKQWTSCTSEEYSSAPSPEIILLDLNLPRKDGREVLAEIKGDPSLRHIPVIILTTSEDEEDIWRSYELQANCFITKPVDMEQFTKALECLGEFRFTLVRLPTPPKP